MHNSWPWQYSCQGHCQAKTLGKVIGWPMENNRHDYHWRFQVPSRAESGYYGTPIIDTSLLFSPYWCSVHQILSSVWHIWLLDKVHSSQQQPGSLVGLTCSFLGHRGIKSPGREKLVWLIQSWENVEWQIRLPLVTWAVLSPVLAIFPNKT